MKTKFYDYTGGAHNDVCQWWYSNPKRQRITVLVYGLDGWSRNTVRYAAIDDFGTLVPVG